MGDPDPTGKGKIWGSNPRLKHAIANCSQTVSSVLPPGEYKRGAGWTCRNDSVFHQITLVFLRML